MQQALTWFYKSVSYKNSRRLVLKSPTHTGRIGYLSKWFPGAKFVHITRHPHKIFPSTIHLWKSLASVQGYQLPGKDDRRLFSQVNDWYQEMYEGYFDQLNEIPSENIVQVKFEDLVKNPISEIESIYSAFDLPDFGKARLQLEQYWSQRKSHRTNKTSLSDETRALIDEVWSDYIEEFGYVPATAELSKVG